VNRRPPTLTRAAGAAAALRPERPTSAAELAEATVPPWPDSSQFRAAEAVYPTLKYTLSITLLTLQYQTDASFLEKPSVH